MSAVIAPPDDLDLVQIHLEGVCRTCRHRHKLVADPRSYLQQQLDWLHKHRQCDPEGVLFVSTGREIPRGFDDSLMEQHGRAPWWLNFKPNADVKIAYAASAELTWTLASLATSSTLVAGRESTAVSNATNKYVDFLCGAKVTTGTSPTTSKTIEVWCYGAFKDTPVYPDSFSASDSNRSVTSRDIAAASLRLVGAVTTDATSNRTYWFSPVSVASLFGGLMPTHFGLWGVHDTAANLNSTGSNHAGYYTGVYATVV